MLSRFTQFLDSFEFAKAAFEATRKVELEAFLERRRDVKWLIEEVLPVAVFAQYLRNPELYVAVRWFEDPESRDAELRLEGPAVEGGFYKPCYAVEVTTAVSKNDYLRREALLHSGVVFGGDKIQRSGKRGSPVVSEPDARDGDQSVLDAADWIIECVRKKCRKTYPQHCLLIVNVLPDRRLTTPDWARVHEAVASQSLESAFVGVWAVDVYHSDVVWLPVRYTEPAQ